MLRGEIQPLSEGEIELIGLFGMGRFKMFTGHYSDTFSIDELAERLIKQRQKQTPELNFDPTWAKSRVKQIIEAYRGRDIVPEVSEADCYRLEEVKCPETGEIKYHLVSHYSDRARR